MSDSCSLYAVFARLFRGVVRQVGVVWQASLVRPVFVLCLICVTCLVASPTGAAAQLSASSSAGKILVGYADDPIISLIESDGSNRQDFDLVKPAISATLAYDQGPNTTAFVIVAEKSDAGTLSGFNIRNAERVWTKDLGLNVVHLAYAGRGRVAVYSKRGDIRIISVADGRILNSFSLEGSLRLAAAHPKEGGAETFLSLAYPFKGRRTVGVLEHRTDQNPGTTTEETVDTFTIPNRARRLAISPSLGIAVAQVIGLNGFIVRDLRSGSDPSEVEHKTSIGLPSLITELGFLDFDGFNSCKGVTILARAKQVWSTCGHNLNVHSVESNSFPEIAHMRMPEKGESISVSPDGSEAFIVFPDTDEILVVDAASRQFVRRFTVGDEPRFVLALPKTSAGPGNE
ncbi:MAG: hypothetical protein AAF668_13355 [Pseudomonadota bacterium]